MQYVRNPVSLYFFFIVHQDFFFFLTLIILHFYTTGPTELVGSSEKLGMTTNLSSNVLKGIEIFGYITVERRLLSTLQLT